MEGLGTIAGAKCASSLAGRSAHRLLRPTEGRGTNHPRPRFPPRSLLLPLPPPLPPLPPNARRPQSGSSLPSPTQWRKSYPTGTPSKGGGGCAAAPLLRSRSGKGSIKAFCGQWRRRRRRLRRLVMLPAQVPVVRPLPQPSAAGSFQQPPLRRTLCCPTTMQTP